MAPVIGEEFSLDIPFHRTFSSILVNFFTRSRNHFIFDSWFYGRRAVIIEVATESWALGARATGLAEASSIHAVHRNRSRPLREKRIEPFDPSLVISLHVANYQTTPTIHRMLIELRIGKARNPPLSSIIPITHEALAKAGIHIDQQCLLNAAL